MDNLIQKNDRNYGIDVLRIVLALIIMVGHFFIFFDTKISILTFAVPFFFTITGFLITKSFYKIESSKIKNKLLYFYTRRFFRIVPVFLIVMFLFREFFPITYFYEKLFFISNFIYFIEIDSHHQFIESFSNFNIHGDHMWYMSVLEQYYFLSPIIMFSLYKFRIIGFSLLILLSIIIRVYVLEYLDYAPYGFIIPINIEYFLWGGLGYAIIDKYKSSIIIFKSILPVSILGFILVLFLQVNSYGFIAYHIEVTHYQSGIALFLALILLGMNFSLENVFCKKAIEFISYLTYTVCLIHPFIQYYFMFDLSMFSIQGFIFSTIVTFFISIILAYFFEKPIDKVGSYVCKKIL